MISVIVATYNGELTLPLMLEALCQVRKPSAGREFIFVDNASTDGSADLIRRYADRLPLTLLREERQGKNFAVSTGVAAARGDLILFTDDDVIPDPEWLVHYEYAAEKQSDVCVFAGQVRHHWMKTPASWLEQLARDGLAFAGTPERRTAGPIQAVAIKGANFLIRAPLFKDFEFNTAIGPTSSGAYAAGSETEFLLRVESANYTMQFIPEAKIKHIVRPDQMMLGAILKRYYRIGRGIEATGVTTFHGDLKTIWGYPRFLYRKLALQLFRSFYHVLTGNKYQAVRVLMQVAVQCGRAEQWKCIRQ
tara:strand:+ start:149719 stop:150636 length:918 start_codon:yes stop_codon:yes gene_type:complete